MSCTLARIVALVEQAQEQKSRTEEVADWVGRYYTVVVMFAAPRRPTSAIDRQRPIPNPSARWTR